MYFVAVSVYISVFCVCFMAVSVCISIGLYILWLSVCIGMVVYNLWLSMCISMDASLSDLRLSVSLFWFINVCSMTVDSEGHDSWSQTCCSIY